MKGFTYKSKKSYKLLIYGMGFYSNRLIMRSNNDILVNYESYGGNVPDTLFDYITVDSAMKEAQVEAIKELVKRKWDNSPFSENFKSIDQLALELIKEIEG